MSGRFSTCVVTLLLVACSVDGAKPANVDARADSGAPAGGDDSGVDEEHVDSGADGAQVGADAADDSGAIADGGPESDADACAQWPTSDGGRVEQVALQNATATFSQVSFGGNPVSAAIDGVIQSNNGWSVFETADAAEAQTASGRTNPQTAVFETVTDATGKTLTFKLLHQHPYPGHSLGRFRISVTNDARSEFADAKPTGGDVTADWVTVKPLRVSATAGITLSVGPDDSVIAQGAALSTEYTIVAASPLQQFTGVRLEALADPSLPDNGPGLYVNGNFVLTEILLEVSPEDLLPECR